MSLGVFRKKLREQAWSDLLLWISELQQELKVTGSRDIECSQKRRG